MCVKNFIAMLSFRELEQGVCMANVQYCGHETFKVLVEKIVKKRPVEIDIGTDYRKTQSNNAKFNNIYLVFHLKNQWKFILSKNVQRCSLRNIRPVIRCVKQYSKYI